MMDDEVVRYLLAKTSAEDPFNFDADPDPGSAPKKWIRIQVISLRFTEFV